MEGEGKAESMMGYFEIFADSVAGFRFRLTDGYENVLVTSTGFDSKLAAVAAIRAVRESAATALVVDHSAILAPPVGNSDSLPVAEEDR